MKNVLIISSTPRKDGNSEILAKEFYKGANDAGHNVELINLKNYNLKYCIGCYSCHKDGICIHNDGMNEITKKLTEADVIVLATPVYFYTMSGQLKVFIDRLVPVYQDIKADIYLIATQWDNDLKIMENTINSIRGCTKDCFEGCNEKGIIYGVGLENTGEVLNHPDYLKQAYEFGKKC